VAAELEWFAPAEGKRPVTAVADSHRLDWLVYVGHNTEGDMAIRFSRSAFQHGVTRERSRHVVEHCICPLYPPDPDDEDLIVFLGPDGHGIALEVIGVELADGDLLVIHAMRLRRRYLDDYAKVMACRAL
jgi:hypothetical protein